ncbi:MAG: hypothetical protein M0Z51_16575 [Propionibacterium sp.]|nr:hypothetical protein [Propionibacterium sp.]
MGHRRHVPVAAQSAIVIGVGIALLAPAPASPVTLAADPDAAGLSGYGTALLDGRLADGEWEQAGRNDLLLSVPAVEGGGQVPATLLVMNDGTNLYIALRVGRVSGFTGFWVDFNNDDDGSLVPEDGDDQVGATFDGEAVRFIDSARLWCVPTDLGHGTWCAPPDDVTAPDYPVPGTVDGSAAAGRPDGMTVLELVHPLASGDARDFRTHPGSTVGFQLRVQLASRNRGVPCDEQWELCSTSAWSTGRIGIVRDGSTAPAPGPAATATLGPNAGRAGWVASATTARMVGGRGTAAITYWASTQARDSSGRSLGGTSRGAVTITGSQAVVPIDVEGTTMLHFYATGTNGRAGPWQTMPVRIDTTPPAVSPAHVSFLSPSTLGLGVGSSRVTWYDVDRLSGVVRHEVQESRAGGPYVTVAAGGLAPGQLIRRLTVGVSYRYRVRAVDAAGNVSQWATGPAYRVRLVDSSDPSVALTGSWRTQVADSAIGGSTVYSTMAGATAKLQFYGSAVAWVAPTGPGRGSASVVVDGTQPVYLSVVRPTATGRLVYGRSWSGPGFHTIEVRVEGTPGRPRVDVDGFLLIEPAGSGGEGSTMYEVEALPASTSTVEPAPMVEWNAAQWSGGRQLVWPASGPGSLWLEVPVGQAGRFRTVLYGSSGPDRGRVEVQYNTWPSPTVTPIDLYAPRVSPTGPIPLGEIDASGPGWMRLEVRVTGRNTASSGYTVGLDRIVLVPTQ